MTEERDYRETPSEDEAEREGEGERREAVAGAQWYGQRLDKIGRAHV